MSEHQKDEKWLDEQLQRAVDGATPTFDAQAWKQKYAHEYEALLARGKENAGWGKPHPTMRILRGPVGKIALAAVILIGAGVLLVGRFGTAPDWSAPALQPSVQPSPAQMVSMISLSAAFRRGGIDELDKQCDRALEELGPRPNSVSVHELLKDINKG